MESAVLRGRQLATGPAGPHGRPRPKDPPSRTAVNRRRAPPGRSAVSSRWRAPSAAAASGWLHSRSGRPDLPRGRAAAHRASGPAGGDASSERETRSRPAEGRERRGPGTGGRRSWDETPGRPARPDRARGGNRAQERPAASRSRPARAGTDRAPARGPWIPGPDGDGAGRRPRESGPRLPDTITAQQLDPDARAQLNSLPNDLADTVARYLVAAGMAEDPERGYEYALAARRLAARVGVVREALGSPRTGPGDGPRRCRNSVPRGA